MKKKYHGFAGRNHAENAKLQRSVSDRRNKRGSGFLRDGSSPHSVSDFTDRSVLALDSPLRTDRVTISVIGRTQPTETKGPLKCPLSDKLGATAEESSRR
jgi:hypothetical protein